MHINLVALLLRLAAAYHAASSVSRDPPDVKVAETFRKVVLKVHPDKSGCVSDAQKLQDARVTITLSLQLSTPQTGFTKKNASVSRNTDPSSPVSLGADPADPADPAGPADFRQAGFSLAAFGRGQHPDRLAGNAPPE